MKQGQAASKSGTGIKTQTESPERQNKGALFDAQDSNQGSTPCYGDSGGPALVDFHGRIAVLGILSTGSGSCPRWGTTSFVNPAYPEILRFIRKNS